MLEVTGLTKAFGSFQAVKGINFSIEKGRCTALLGPNGAGKTTTLRMLTGLLEPSGGSIAYREGKQVTATRPEDYRQLIGYLPQMPSFYNWMNGMEYVVYAGRLCGLSTAEAKKKAGLLLKRVGLEQAAKRKIGGYSGGMRQRLGLAQALVHEPRLLVMDEPVSALDPIGRREVLSLLQELKSEMTILFSTHVLHDAEELCDDIIIIREGEVALSGSLQQVQQQHRQPIIEVRLEGEGSEGKQKLESWLRAAEAAVSSVSGKPLFDNIEKQERLILFTAQQLDEGRQWLMEHLTRNQLKISKLEVGHSSLEQLFMRVVSER
ncbi:MULTISPECIES: ABC transporter ATP-binding protein [unclassified Paenibacillus]|uniref:ABC transporter ATP-binding protein n=1 Tax=unclassified Paenibacillus TaxID=185978 RepID=UPI002F42B80A